MKSRLLWALVVLAAAAGFYYTTIRPTQVYSPGFSRKRPPLRNLKPPEFAPPPIPQPVIATPTLPLPAMNQPLVVPPLTARREPRASPQMEVPIQDSATIDFSIGAPVVRSQTKDQEALDRALKEMAEAAKGVTFTPKN